MAASRDSFRFLVLSRGLRSVAIIYMTLAAPLYLDFINISLPQIGLIYVAVMLFAGALNMALGMLGDRYGYKKALLLAEILPMLAAFTIGFTENTALLIAAVILGGVGGVAGGIRGTFTPGTTALVASSYPDDKERVKRLSSLTKIGSIASILGALMLIGHTYLTGVFGIAGAYRILFAVAGAVMALSFISLLFVQSDKRPEKTTTMMKRSSLIYTLKVSGANMINGAAIGISMPLFPLILGIAFHIPIELLSLTVGLVYIPSYVGVAFGSYFAGRYSGRHNIVKVASYARISSGILLLGMSAVISMAYLGFGPSLYLLAYLL